MSVKRRQSGSVMLMVIFAIALLTALVAGMLSVNTDEIQLMQNQLFATQAQAIAEAGVDDAFSQLRNDAAWSDGYTDKVFHDGSYSVTVAGVFPNLTVESLAMGPYSFRSRIAADVTLAGSGPFTIRIDELRINE